MNITENDDRVVQILSDHRDLLECICCIRDWTRAVSEWGVPRFGELGSRLAPFRDSLARHFADEESGKYSPMASERDAQALHAFCEKHQQLLERLDKLIEALRAPEPEYHSWQTAVDQIESLFNDICDHEQQESAALQSAASEPTAAKTGSV